MRNSLTYDGVHDRVRKYRGPARQYPCGAPDCEAGAQDWAWNRTGSYRQGFSRTGKWITWGTDWTQYVPACPTHARQLDRGGNWEHCPKGHPRHVGTDRKGNCRACKSPARFAGAPDPLFTLDEREPISA
jgi:hypothetical protein